MGKKKVFPERVETSGTLVRPPEPDARFDIFACVGCKQISPFRLRKLGCYRDKTKIRLLRFFFVLPA